MESGKLLREPEWQSLALEPTGTIDLIFIRRRADLPVGDEIIAPCASPALDSMPPVHERSKRWQSDEAFEMRRITPLLSKDGELLGYRPMIQQGRGPTSQRFHASFRIADLGSEEALRQAKKWRDDTESKLGIRPGLLRSKAVQKPVSGISLIVSMSKVGRSYWGSDKVPDKPTLRVYIGKKSYTDAYQELFQRLAKRDGLPLPAELPFPPPPRRDQYKRMIKAGFTDIPLPPTRKRKAKAASSA